MVHQPRSVRKNAQLSQSRQGVRPADDSSNNSQEEYDAEPSYQQYGKDQNQQNSEQGRGFSKGPRGSNQNQGHGLTGNYCSQCGSYIGKNANTDRQTYSNTSSQNGEQDDEDNGQHASQSSGLKKQTNNSSKVKR